MYNEGFCSGLGGDGKLNWLCFDALHVSEPLEEDKEAKCDSGCVGYQPSINMSLNEGCLPIGYWGGWRQADVGGVKNVRCARAG